MSSPGAPEDPFDRPPNESGRPPKREPVAPADPTAPIQPGAYPGAYPGSVPGGQPGYWEQQAAQQRAGQPQEGQAQEGQPQEGQPPPAYGQSPYGQGGYGQGGYGQGGYGQGPYGQGGYAPAYPQPAYGGYAPGAYGYAVAPAHPSATTSLVLGLIGLIGAIVACGLPLVVSPFAIVVGRRTMREIDASNGQLGGRSNAKAGFVMGIIGTVLLALVVVGIVLLIVGLAVAGSSGGYTEY